MEQQTIERLRGILQQSIRQGITAGANLLIKKDGAEVCYLEEGLADRENGTPICRDTIFRLYSMTKPVTSAAAMILMERGQLDFAEPVAAYLPEFEELYVEEDGAVHRAETPLTVLHLLNMTSGLSYGGDRTEADRKMQAWIDACGRRLHTEHEADTQEFAAGIARLPLLFEPGSSWNYSASADVLGAVIERASGMRFGEFLQKELFDPLGMKDTGFWVPQEKQPRLARVYQQTETGAPERYTGEHLLISHEMARPPKFESGGAGLVSTIDDYARFAQMLLCGGTADGVRILSGAAVRYMTSGRLSAAQQASFDNWHGLEGHTYAHLLRIMTEPGSACTLGARGEYGWDGWLGCYFANIPEQNLTILLMQQKANAGTIPMTRRLRNVILSGL